MASSVKSDKGLEFQDDDLAVVRQQFEEYMEGTQSARKLAEKCRDYKDGNQWTSAERDTLKKRKQPCITDNKIQDKCDTLMGIEKQMRSDPKAFPRTPGDDESADAATDSLRYIADCNDFNRTGRKPATDNLIVEGLCFGQVIVEKQKGQYVKIGMEHIRWDRGYVDIHALRDDFDDKTYCGYFRWMDAEDAKREFKGREAAIDQSTNSGGASVANVGESADDKPRYIMTVRKRSRVQVFKHYWRKNGVWKEGVWCAGGWLEDLKPCEYKDEHGEPYCCMEIQATYRDGDGNPYGLVPRWLDLQDEHNKRRSKMLHLLNAKRVITQRGSIVDDKGGIQEIRDELHKPDGVITLNGDIAQFRVEDNLNEAQGQWQLLQQTDLALSQTGPNAALQGNTGSLSGRAKQLDQQAGSLMVTPVFEALDSWELRMYRQAWCRVKQYWTAPMWIRVTDDENTPKFVGLNQPVLVGDLAAQAAKNDQEFQSMPPEEQRAHMEALAQHPQAQAQAIVEGKPQVKNNTAEIDVDIIIDRVQDTVNVQAEQFDILAKIADRRPEVPFEVLVDISQLRADTKKRVRDKLSGNDPASQAQAKMMQVMQELQAALAAANVRKAEADANRAEAGAAKDMAATAETEIDTAVKVATFTDGQQTQPASKSQVSVN